MNEFNRADSSSRLAEQAYIDEGLRSHMLRVYNYMIAALSLTGIVAWFGASSGLYQSLADSSLIFVVMLAPLGVVFFFAAKINSMSSSKAQSVFWIFAGLMGLSLSYVFIYFTGAKVFQAFFVTAGAFSGLSIWGYTTKKNLEAMGTFLIMGLLGLIIAMIVNFFFQSGSAYFVINVLGVLIFAGLTAWDTQKIKREWLNMVRYSGQEVAEKSAIMGALTLYLDFINLFLFILRFMGNRD